MPDRYGTSVCSTPPARPRSTAFGTDAYPTLQGRAAALLHPLARNHALVDGNERLAWPATVVCLELNGRSVEMDDDAPFALVMEVAAGTRDVPQIVVRLAVS